MTTEPDTTMTSDDQSRVVPTGDIGSASDRTLLDAVHTRLGGLGVDIQTFGESDRVEIRWRRDYDGEWSDERFWSATSIEAAFRAVLEYEDNADRDEAVPS